MPKNNFKIKNIIIAIAFICSLVLIYKVSFRKKDGIEKLLITTSKDSEPLCQKTYYEFYSSDTIYFTIAFGYKDSRPQRLVTDRYEAMILSEELLSQCQNLSYACGFYRSSEDMELFFRYIIGPDRRVRKIVLRILSSSVGPDDSENRGSPLHKWETSHIESNFYEAIMSNQLVFYNGHSRDGGGPDFSPPRITKSLHTDYFWYRVHKNGINKMLASLRSSKTKPKLIGIFSCSSKKHFVPMLLEASSDSAFIITQNSMYHSDGIKGLLAVISALIGQYCKTDFELELKNSGFYTNFEIINFFKY